MADWAHCLQESKGKGRERNDMIYAGCYTPVPGRGSEEKKCGIEMLEWDSENVLHKRTVTESSNPSWLIQDRNKKLVYAANEEEQGGVTRFVRTEEGALVRQDSIRFPGQSSCHLCLSPDEAYLYAADYDSGDLAVLDCRQERMSLVQQIEYTGRGSYPIRQEAAHIHSSWCLPLWGSSVKEFSGDGELLVADLGTDRLYRYLIGKEQPLIPHPIQPWIQLPPGSGPRHAAFHWKAKAVYVTAELSNQVFLIRFDEKNMGHVEKAWQLTEEHSENYTSHLELWPERRLLYTAVRGADELVWFLVDEDSGELSFRGRCPSGGEYPRHFMVDRKRNCLLVANQHSGNLSILQLDGTGDIIFPPVQQIEIPNVVCVLESE